MTSIDLTCSIRTLRRFLILSCCYSFIPENYLEDEKVFPERLTDSGMVYTEAEDKSTLEKVREIQFIKAENVAAVTYNSKSGSTRLRWEHTTADQGKLTGTASVNAIFKLVEAGVIRKPIQTSKKPKKPYFW